jgi:pseudaminic acid synthase
MKKYFDHEIKISEKIISKNNFPYIIAEMSANHNGSIENAFNLLLAAKKAGADAIKIQTYKPDTITINCQNNEFLISKGLWAGQSLYELYEKAHMPWEWHLPIFEYAKEIGITIFSSPFDKSAIDLLESLDCPAYKIASFEIVDHELIKYAANTQKPLIISTGMANFEEISEAVSVARNSGCKQLALLHCVSGYPTDPRYYNLRTIPDLIEKFDTLVGISDHTISNITANAAVSLGACIIEKHFTLSRDGGGPDDSFSMEPDDLKDLSITTKITKNAMGVVNYGPLDAEKFSFDHRRSLYFIKDISKGEVIDEKCIKSIRPGNGLKPKYYFDVIGKKASRDIKFGTPVSWEDIK